jgi:hypothetical protein
MAMERTIAMVKHMTMENGQDLCRLQCELNLDILTREHNNQSRGSSDTRALSPIPHLTNAPTTNHNILSASAYIDNFDYDNSFLDLTGTVVSDDDYATMGNRIYSVPRRLTDIAPTFQLSSISDQESVNSESDDNTIINSQLDHTYDIPTASPRPFVGDIHLDLQPTYPYSADVQMYQAGPIAPPDDWIDPGARLLASILQSSRENVSISPDQYDEDIGENTPLSSPEWGSYADMD